MEENWCSDLDLTEDANLLMHVFASGGTFKNNTFHRDFCEGYRKLRIGS